MRTSSPHVLVILDGFGDKKEREGNAIAQASLPTFHYLTSSFPTTSLEAAGKAVGLPLGVIGNSEVGHLTIGAGRIIKQTALILNEAIENNTLATHPVLTHSLEQSANKKKSLHLMGLLSDAYVHAHERHAHAFLRIASAYGFSNIFIHPFLDGRDVPPRSAARYLEHLEKVMYETQCGSIGSLHGRFYAMDRDNNKERTQKSVAALLGHNAPTASSWQEVLENSYAHNISDEFIEPIQLNRHSIMQEGDSILFWNYRADRARQLTQALLEQGPALSEFITPVSYSTQLRTSVLYPSTPLFPTLRSVLVEHNKTLFSIAETEKYAHVTYFFNGGSEEIAPGEHRIMIPSLKNIPTYASHPEMSAAQLTQEARTYLKTHLPFFSLINYANADMVGHSGDLSATIKAVECLDEQLLILYNTVVKELKGTLYITADHGKAESMYDQRSEQPRTAHSTSRVPFIFVNQTVENKPFFLSLTQLADIAPFILACMNLPIPQEMTRPIKSVE